MSAEGNALNTVLYLLQLHVLSLAITLAENLFLHGDMGFGSAGLRVLILLFSHYKSRCSGEYLLLLGGGEKLQVRNSG